LKIDNRSSELKSFIEDVSKFGVVSVTTKHCSTSLVKIVAFQAQIPQENKLGVTSQLTKKTIVDFQPKVGRRIRIHGSDTEYYQSQFFWFPWQTILFLIPLANFVLLTPSLPLFVFQFYLNGR
jgi:hypothetical protein